MAKDLEPIRQRLEWAKAQVTVLGVETQIFFESKPYTIRIEFDTDGFVYKLKYTHPMPDSIPIAIGAVVHAVRSSLDHLAVALAKRNGATKTNDVYFPISSNEDAFFNGRKSGIKKINRLSIADIEVIKKLKPYKGGNDALYAIHQLDLLDKHNRLIKTAGFIGSVGVFTAYGLKIGGDIDTWGTVDDERTILWTQRPNAEFEIMLDICFNEIGHNPGKSFIGTLRDFIGLVESIVNLFD